MWNTWDASVDRERDPEKFTMKELDLNSTIFEEGDYVMVINTSKVKMFFRTMEDISVPLSNLPSQAQFLN